MRTCRPRPLDDGATGVFYHGLGLKTFFQVSRGGINLVESTLLDFIKQRIYYIGGGTKNTRIPTSNTAGTFV